MSDEQDKLLREIFALHATHGIKALPHARMLLAKFLVEDHKAFREVVDCNTRLTIADEAESIAKVAAATVKGSLFKSATGPALQMFADNLRDGVKRRGAIVHECTPDDENITEKNSQPTIENNTMQTANSEDSVTLERGDDVELATRLLLKLRGDSPEKIVYDRNNFWRYNPTTDLWNSIKENEMFRSVGEFSGMTATDGGSVRLSHSRVRDIVACASSFADAPGFFDTAPSGIMFQNGFVVVRRGEVTLLPHSSAHKAQIGLEFDYDATHAPERWLRFMGEIINEDGCGPISAGRRTSHLKFLQEFVGACLLGEAPQYGTCALLLDANHNGFGSVFMNVIKSLFPTGSITHVSPNNWDNSLFMAEMVGARLNLNHDLPRWEITESMPFKRVVTGDFATARHKYKRRFEFAPTAGQLFACNSLRGFGHEKEDYRQFRIVPFDQESMKREWIIDMGKLIFATELPSIAAWAVAGLARLQKNRGYTQSSESTRDAVTRVKDVT